MKMPKNFDEMVAAMLLCEQAKGQTVYQHGQSVNQKIVELTDYLNGTYGLPAGWRIPDWLETYREELLQNLHEPGKIHAYTLYHDCGKPFCWSQNEQTDQNQFKDHANVSAQVWASVGGNEVVGHLIAEDMVLHTATAEEIDKKLANDWSIQDACTLLLAALAEIHSNARLFGGIESVSFKQKWKTLDRRGKQICKYYFKTQTTRTQGGMTA